MSMSQANAALVIDTYAETARLGITLTEAERIVEQSTKRMEKKVDGSFGQIGNKITKMLSAAVGAGLAIKVVDDALRAVADGIKSGQGAEAIGLAIGDAVAESLKGIPVVGALGQIIGTAIDPLMGGAMGTADARANAIAMQNARMEAEKEYQRLLALGFSEEEARLAKKAEMEKAIRESAAKAAEQFNQTEKKYDEEAYQRAVEAARNAPKSFTEFLASFGPTGNMITAGGGVNREMFRTSESLTEEASAGQARVIAARDAAIKQLDLQFERETAALEARAAADAARASEARKREEERAAAEEERRLKAQEEAYDRFVEGNAREALMALEAQLEMASSATAPSRSQRLAGMMQDFGTVSANTALGGFTFAAGDAAQISQSILANAERQLATLERIEDLQQEIRDFTKEQGLR